MDLIIWSSVTLSLSVFLLIPTILLSALFPKVFQNKEIYMLIAVVIISGLLAPVIINHI